MTSRLPKFFLRRFVACPPRQDSADRPHSTKDLIKDQVRLLEHILGLRELTRWDSQLPKKVDRVVFCPLTATQIHAYRKLLACADVDIILTHDQPCPCGATDSDGCGPYSRRR